MYVNLPSLIVYYVSAVKRKKKSSTIYLSNLSETLILTFHISTTYAAIFLGQISVEMSVKACAWSVCCEHRESQAVAMQKKLIRTFNIQD